jgi:hypothetical protein
VRYLSLAEVLVLHRLVMEQGRQQPLLRDLGALESAVAQPRQTFGGEDLYPGLTAKAAALGLMAGRPVSCALRVSFRQSKGIFSRRRVSDGVAGTH